MQNERFVELLVDLHMGLSRLGPGSTEMTLKALAFCESLPSKPDILDVGCGTGAQTLVLAAATQGRIVATDLIPDFVHQLKNNIVEKGLTEQISLGLADMNALPFADESFDLIWSEGAIYIMGFDEGLRKWKPLLKPSGYLVVSEVSWFKHDPPAELKDFWSENYPAIRSVEDNIDAARALGWTLVENFHLPVTAWTKHYYAPLLLKLPAFRRDHTGDAEAQGIADMTENEMRMMERFSEFYGYEFIILRK